MVTGLDVGFMSPMPYGRQTWRKYGVGLRYWFYLLGAMTMQLGKEVACGWGHIYPCV